MIALLAFQGARAKMLQSGLANPQAAMQQKKAKESVPH